MSTETQLWRGHERQRSAQRAEILRPYIIRLFVTDAILIFVSICTAHIVRFGADDVDVSGAQWLDHLQLSYMPFMIVVGLLWVALLATYHAYVPRYLGSGTEEYRNVVGATMLLFGGLAVLSYLLKLQISRGYFLVALPLGLALLLIGHWVWRRWLNGQRKHGRFVASALIVGGSSTARPLLKSLPSHLTRV